MRNLLTLLMYFFFSKIHPAFCIVSLPIYSLFSRTFNKSLKHVIMKWMWQPWPQKHNLCILLPSITPHFLISFVPGKCTEDNWGSYIIMTWAPKFSKAYQRSVTLLNSNIHHWGLDLRLKLQVFHKEQKRFNLFVSLTIQNTELSSFLASFQSWSSQALMRSSPTFFPKSCIQSITFNFY